MAENTLMDFPNLARALEEYGERLIEEYRKELKEQGINASGKLSRNVSFELRVQGDRVLMVAVNLEEYWRFVETGRRPTKNMSSDGRTLRERIADWIEIKPVIPRPDKNGRIPSTKSLAFLIARKIHNKGYEGKHPFETAQKNLANYYEMQIRRAAQQDARQVLQVLFKEHLPSLELTNGTGGQNR